MKNEVGDITLKELGKKLGLKQLRREARRLVKVLQKKNFKKTPELQLAEVARTIDVIFAVHKDVSAELTRRKKDILKTKSADR